VTATEANVLSPDELIVAVRQLTESAKHGPKCWISGDDTHCFCPVGQIRDSLPRCSYSILVEGSSKKDPGKVTGRTRSNKLVHFVDETAEPGSFRTVEVASASPHHLEGQPIGGSRRDAPRTMALPLLGSTAGCSSCP